MPVILMNEHYMNRGTVKYIMIYEKLFTKEIPMIL